MAFNRTKWQDHVVERPRTFTEVTNADGSVLELGAGKTFICIVPTNSNIVFE